MQMQLSAASADQVI